MTRALLAQVLPTAREHFGLLTANNAVSTMTNLASSLRGKPPTNPPKIDF